MDLVGSVFSWVLPPYLARHEVEKSSHWSIIHSQGCVVESFQFTTHHAWMMILMVRVRIRHSKFPKFEWEANNRNLAPLKLSKSVCHPSCHVVSSNSNWHAYDSNIDVINHPNLQYTSTLSASVYEDGWKWLILQSFTRIPHFWMLDWQIHAFLFWYIFVFYFLFQHDRN